MEINYPEIGICGLSCRLCPTYQTNASSKCCGCKSKNRIVVGCPFISCAIKHKGVEFCWDCEKSESCEKWRGHRDAGKSRDSFKSYQKLEDDINFVKKMGIKAYDEQQKTRESILLRLLNEFNEGRSKSYYCIAATVMAIDELNNCLQTAATETSSHDIKEKSKLMHALLNDISLKKGYYLGLRK
jgi:hypothetical protein